MWRKALHAVTCWLMLSESLGETDKVVQNSIVNINSAGSARLYRNAPVGVYGATAPYGAYSFNIPTFIATPKAAPNAASFIPFKDQLLSQSSNAYLRDSYGNKYNGSPQSFLPYKSQQFVSIQGLPSHLAQPLLAFAPQSKPVTPHYFVGQQFRLPNFQVAAQPVSNLSPFATYNTKTPLLAQTAQQQPSSNKAVYANSQFVEQFKNINNFPKFERLEYKPNVVHQSQDSTEIINQSQSNEDVSVPIKSQRIKTAVPTVVNGQKTVVHVDTKPPLPLLDLNLLEPLTFANPLVPQVQHYLPRINEATYRALKEMNEEPPKQNKEFFIHKTKTYESGPPKGKKATPPKKKPKQHFSHHHKQSPPANPQINTTPDESPEISYEISSPNYKETIKEKTISYNKNTNSEPTHYSYEKKTEADPIHYNYQNTDVNEPVNYSIVHSSNKKPVQNTQANYNGEQDPRQLIYTFMPNDHAVHSNGNQRKPEGNYKVPRLVYQEFHLPNQVQNNQYHQQPNLVFQHRSNGEYHYEPTQKEYHDTESQQPDHRALKQQSHNKPTESQVEKSQTEYERDTYQPHNDIHTAEIKVDPAQHVKDKKSHEKSHSSDVPEDKQTQKLTYTGQPVIHEKGKHIIIQEESPDEIHSHREQIMAEVIDEEDNNEEDFEDAYKNAAYGFPAFEKKSADIEKDIYNPESYGAYHGNSDFKIEEKSPFHEYVANGDEFPKSARLTYKDTRDDTKENYYLDYSVHKPESSLDRHKSKSNYYKLYKDYKPQRFLNDDQDKKREKEQQKYTVPLSYDFEAAAAAPKQKSNAYFAQYKSEPIKYEYDFNKKAPRDNTAHASHPFQKLRTHFVEPTFQYGFEPSSLPRLLDSELAAMASNNSPESEKPGMRKKIYKENWYIKKTSTSAGKPS